MNTLSLAVRFCSANVVVALFLTTARADDCIIPRERHPWAAFRPGSWKLVRVTTESFDKDGKSTGVSVTETKTMLLSADASSYELQVEVSVDVAGKRFPSQPRVTRQGFQGEGEGQRATVRRLGAMPLKVAGRALQAQTAEIEIAGKDSRKVIRVNYGAGIHPFILSRQSVTYDAAGTVQQESDVQTQAVQVPRTVLGARRFTWEARTTQQHPAGKVVTDEIHCFDIPGGVVEHTSEEFDDKDTLLRRSKLELINYGIAVADKAPRWRDTPRRSRVKHR